MLDLIPRHWRMGLVALAVALVGLPASSALADGGATATHPSFSFSFKAKHGWHITVSGFLCGGTGNEKSSVSVSASKSGRASGKAFSFSHGWSAAARKSGCSGGKSLSSGRMHAHWGKLFYLKMSIKGAGAKTTIPAPKDCTGVLGHQRPVTAHGTLRLRIHKSALGSINKSKLKGMAQLFDSSKNFHCKGGGSHIPKFTSGFGSFGTSFLSATKYDKTGATNVFVDGSDRPGRGVFGGFGDSFSGAPFTFSKDLTTATIGSVGPFMSGSVSFTGTSSSSPGCESGTWNAGTLKVHDGLSKLTLAGSSNVFGSLNKSTASC